MVLEGRFTTPGAGSAIIRSLQVHDPKQYWGLEDFMNVSPTGVTNAVNLSLFMVNVATVSGLTAISVTQTIVFLT